jgi:hypothetical protein
MKYLGVDINPWGPRSGSGAGSRVLQAAGNCARSDLKPKQKIEILVWHIIPRFLYVFIEDVPSWIYLNTTDQQLRQVFKRIVHLSSGTSTGFMYAKKRDGGLGLPRLAPWYSSPT